MTEEPPAEEPIGEDARIDALDTRLKAAREREDQRTNPAKSMEANASYQMGNRVLAELLGGIGGGAGIGWVIDHFAGTSPWGLLVVMMLGIVAAFRNIIRMSNRRPD
jgi:ATP synthase protein I